MLRPLLVLVAAAALGSPAWAAEKDKTHDRKSMCEKDWATASAAGTTGGKAKDVYISGCLMGDPKPTQTVRPAGVTGICNDGTNSSEPNKAAACAGHGGVATWLKSAAAKG